MEVLDEREQLRKQEMAIRDRIREIDGEINQSTVRRIMEGDCYFRFDDLEHSPRQSRSVYVHVLDVQIRPNGCDYDLSGIRAWPDIPRIERGGIGWTLHACRSAWENPQSGEKITKGEFDAQLEATFSKIKTVDESLKGE